MLWPSILPFQLTCLLLALGIAVATIWAIKRKRSPVRTCLLSIAIAGLLFIPTCGGLQVVLAPIRFGHSEVGSVAEINDFRAERYLPPAATEIHLFKNHSGNGYRAKYRLSEVELIAYLDDLWRRHGGSSAVPRQNLDRGRTILGEQMTTNFRDTGWQLPREVRTYKSPIEGDGGGATYYLDVDSNTVFQRTGYW